MSVAEVVDNPNDPWAWAGLAGDAIDVLVPCFGGVGEVVKTAKGIDKAADAVDDVYDYGKAQSKLDNYVQVKTKGKENIRDSELSGYSVDEVKDMYENSTDKQLKKQN